MPAIKPIRTTRLVIRDWKYSDWKAVQEYAGDAEVCRSLMWGPNSSALTRAFMRVKVAEQRHHPRMSYELGIALRSTGELIGSVGMRIVKPRLATADLGYVLARKHWGHGYMTEAAEAMIRWGFTRLKLHRIFATCNQRNRRSARVLEKCGMRREAAFKQDNFVKGKWRDSYLYAILRSEFKR